MPELSDNAWELLKWYGRKDKGFVQQRLNMSQREVDEAQKELIEMGLIERVKDA